MSRTPRTRNGVPQQRRSRPAQRRARRVASPAIAPWLARPPTGSVYRTRRARRARNEGDRARTCFTTRLLYETLASRHEESDSTGSGRADPPALRFSRASSPRLLVLHDVPFALCRRPDVQGHRRARSPKLGHSERDLPAVWRSAAAGPELLTTGGATGEIEHPRASGLGHQGSPGSLATGRSST